MINHQTPWNSRETDDKPLGLGDTHGYPGKTSPYSGINFLLNFCTSHVHVDLGKMCLDILYNAVIVTSNSNYIVTNIKSHPLDEPKSFTRCFFAVLSANSLWEQSTSPAMALKLRDMLCWI